MDWIQLFDDNSIDYVSRGPNTKRGEVSVQCPYCGTDDPSHHLGISLSSENWGCHRSPEHRGKNPTKLVAAILGCTFPRAKLIVQQYSKPDPDGLTDLLDPFEVPAAPPEAASSPVSLPDEFRPIKPTGLTAKFWRYLEGRSFDDVDALCHQYGLMCALTGRYKDRVIIPFYKHNKLQGWTGRAIINPKEAPRYLSSGAEVKNTVFMEDQLYQGDQGWKLIVVEGPFDALKLDYYGYNERVRTTCTFGTSMTMEQIGIINEVSQLFDHTYLLFDPEAIAESFNARDWLIGQRISVSQVPDGIEDPGAMTKRQVRDFVRGLK